MLFKYAAVDKDGNKLSGTVDSATLEAAMNAIQRRGLVIVSIKAADVNEGGLLAKKLTFFERVKTRDVVLLSRQLATLFTSQISALRIFRLLGSEADNPAMRGHLNEIADDLQGGSSISKALSRHPKIFSTFYVNMARAGEESGKLDETFTFLADSLERSFAIISKAKNAMIYPIFVVATFIVVMVLMLTMVVPKLTAILIESGQEIPLYTRVVIVISDFFVHYGLFLLFGVMIGGFFLWRWSRTPEGRYTLAGIKLNLPYIGKLYRKLYLARIASNLSTMLAAAIPIVKTLEITGDIIENSVFAEIIKETTEDVKGGVSLSGAFAKHKEIPGIMVAMFKVGEESGEMAQILKTMARFYEREVSDAVDALVGLIEPAMVVALGLGVGFLLASVLIPIYNVSMSFA
ncbi:MAG: type II secretion system F family protein [Candidatus Taylorbacteria bacterium]|nr:type II secretion system F family protein [Candidatus Taylorbacteria bacterium]